MAGGIVNGIMETENGTRTHHEVRQRANRCWGFLLRISEPEREEVTCQNRANLIGGK